MATKKNLARQGETLLRSVNRFFVPFLILEDQNGLFILTQYLTSCRREKNMSERVKPAGDLLLAILLPVVSAEGEREREREKTYFISSLSVSSLTIFACTNDFY